MHHAELLEAARSHSEREREDGGRDDGAGDGAHAAEHHHHHHLDGLHEGEQRGLTSRILWTNRPPATPGEGRRDDEGAHLVARGVDAHGLGRDLVLADGEQRPAVGADERGRRAITTMATTPSPTQKMLV